MAITTASVAASAATKPYTVLRALCMAGERVEVGDTVDLTITQYTELASAGKVGPLADKPAKAPKKQKPAPDADEPQETTDVPV